MQLQLKEYTPMQRKFVSWYKKRYWSIYGMNTKDCSLLDLKPGCHEFENEYTALMYDAYKVGRLHAKKENN